MFRFEKGRLSEVFPGASLLLFVICVFWWLLVLTSGFLHWAPCCCIDVKAFTSVLLTVPKMHCLKLVYKISEHFIDCYRTSFKQLLLLVKFFSTRVQSEGLNGGFTCLNFINWHIPSKIKHHKNNFNLIARITNGECG